jgi:NhaA family Na+:H+ antiporter
VPRLLFAVVRPFRRFFRTEAASGITLMVVTVVALLWANSRFAASYEGLLHLPVTFSMGGQGLSWPLHHWINDALMSVFFLVVGMEIKRELLVGELRTVRQATLPALAALGGMLVPAAIHFAFNRGGAGQPGWGVPMATDIAFALGCLALVSSRVPSSLVVFLMALAIFDDLGAILVIAFFYGGKIHAGALLTAGGITGVLVLMARLRVTLLWPFLVLGVALWGAVLKSGIHATIAGVILGLCIPAQGARRPTEVLEDLDRAVTRLRHSARSRDLDAAGPLGAIERHLEAVQPPLDRIVHGLHPWVAFGIVPIFALANAGVAIHGNIADLALSPPALGASLGLFLGKPTGIFGITWLAVKLGLAPRPTGSTWPQLFGVSVLAGIGFTMSIFVATLAFPGDHGLQDASKVGVFLGSAASVAAGLFILSTMGEKQETKAADEDIEIRLDLPRFAEGFRVEPWVAQGRLVGRSLLELDLRNRCGISVLGIHRGGRDSGRGLEPVGAAYKVNEGDTLLLVGSEEDIERFLDLSINPKSVPAPPPEEFEDLQARGEA